MARPILVVDDDVSITTSLALLLKQAGYASRVVHTPAEALRAVDAQEFGAVVQDMNFSRQTTGEEGLALLSEIKGRRPDLPVILITAWGSITLAVQGVKAGAADFLTKPWTNQQVLRCIETALGLAAADAAARLLTREELDSRYDLRGVIGRDPKLLKVLDVVGRVSATDASVLITGESGTGKEVIAEAIHRNSCRREGPFVKVNLGGISSTLFESEMFGHVRGAFTDARQDRQGRFATAQGGTIFLDEIGELEPAGQVKMLRVLQDRVYEVLGSSSPRPMDARVVSATNRSLPEMVQRGEFREDLFYRLNLISLHLPPLRERAGDIPALAGDFLARAATSYGRPELTLSQEAVRWLSSQTWPGNIRQLKHVIERAVLMTPHTELTAADMRGSLTMERGEVQPPSASGPMTLDEMERSMILDSLRRHDGNLTRVAEALGLSRPALYRRLEKYGIQS